MKATDPERLGDQLSELFDQVASPDKYWKPENLRAFPPKYRSDLAATSRRVSDLDDAERAAKHFTELISADTSDSRTIEQIVEQIPRHSGSLGVARAAVAAIPRD